MIDHVDLQRIREDLEPTEEALARMRQRALSDLAPSDLHRASVVSTTRRPRVRLRAGLVASIGVLIAGVVALAPWDGSSPRGTGPTTARAALLAAARSSEDTTWRPLQPGEYFHTMSTSFTPRYPRSLGQSKEEREYRNRASSKESMLDANGHGLLIDVMGGPGDRDSYVRTSPPDRHGRISGFTVQAPPGSMKDPFALVGTMEDSLKYPIVVDATKLPASGAPSRVSWYRTKQGFITGAPFPASALSVKGLSMNERFQRQHWGVTTKEAAQLDEAVGARFDAVLEGIIGPRNATEIVVSQPPYVSGQYRETQRWFDQQIEVDRIVDLLGRAPLSPKVRHRLFQRLADMEHVIVDGADRDERGRPGLRVTFRWDLDEAVDAYTLTLAQLRQDSRDRFQPDAGGPAGGDTAPAEVEAHRSTGQWYQSIVLDERTGAILQSEAWSDYETSIPVPHFGGPTSYGPGEYQLGVQWAPGFYGYRDGTIYDERNVTTSLNDPSSAACADAPKICR